MSFGGSHHATFYSAARTGGEGGIATALPPSPPAQAAT
ncbi:hypothetical protein NY78_0704 [Desulfovibrio sp. TomC]|nr:hypothetical protein NY78_0704 [Desulfovibrio sp. TomC]